MIHIKKWITDQFFFCEHGKVYSKIQTESMGISKDHPPWSNKLLPFTVMQGWFNIWKPVYCNLPYKHTERKNPMIISLDVKISFEKIQHPCMIKVLEDAGIYGTYLNMINSIYGKPVSRSSYGDKLNKIPIISRTRQCCLLSLYLFNIVIDVYLNNWKK